MTHDEFDALPTAEKIASREAEMIRIAADMAVYADRENQHRAYADAFTREREILQGQLGNLAVDLHRLQRRFEDEKAAARAAKRKQAKETTDTPTEPLQ